MPTGTRARSGLVVVLLAAAALPAAQAQQPGWELTCNDRYRGDDAERFCTILDRTLTPSGTIRVDANPNGGVEVVGWDRAEVALHVRIDARAGTVARAEELGRAVRIVTEGGTIRAEGPRTGRRESWWASFELRVPRNSDLQLRAQNGGITVAAVRGTIDVATTNGGLSLRGLGGDVRAETTNGGVDVELTGRRWDGARLDVTTTNGGIELAVPDGYSAELETGTVNGGIDIGFPVQVEGRIGRRLRTTLGSGGSPIRVVTTNGGVTIRRG